MPTDSLIAAVKAGDSQQVKELLSSGCDPNEKGEYGLTPLHVAASHGQREIAVMLTSAGADVHARDVHERTPLHHAVVFGNELIVAHLLLREADPEACGENGFSAIELALLLDQEDIARVLYLASHADLGYARRLARSISTRPSRSSDGADRRIVEALLRDKDIDADFEPLITALLREAREERPQPRRHPTTRPTRPVKPGGSCSSRRADRFSGVPPESVSDKPSWVLVGSDSSVHAGEVEALEESGDMPRIINMAMSELDGIAIDTSLSALALLNEYIRRNASSSEFRRTIEAALMLYTDNRFYRVLNDRWRAGRSRDLIGFSTLMSIAFRHAAYFISGEVYRGVDLHDWHHYEPGLVFRWPFFVSASKDINVAAAFGRTVVTVDVPAFANVREIDYCSLYPDEGEVLFRAYEVFEVLEAGAEGVLLRVFDDEWFGTEYEVVSNRLRRIE